MVQRTTTICDYCGASIPDPPRGGLAATAVIVWEDGTNFHACARCAPALRPGGDRHDGG